MSNTDSRKTTEDIIQSIRSIFQRSSRGAREKAWERLFSTKGKEEIKTLVVNPNRGMNQFRGLITFKEWLNVT